MERNEVAELVFQWAKEQNFDAPYGVGCATGRSQQGRAYRSIYFGYRATLDVSVNVYSENFILLNSSRSGRQVYRSVRSLMLALDRITTSKKATNETD